MSGFKKNTAVTGFPFAMVSATDGSAITTGTVTGYVTLDGGTQATIAGAATHEGNGQWSLNLTAGEMNGDIVGLLFTHTSAIPIHFTIKTDTKIVSELNDIAATAIVSAGAITTSSGAVSTVTTLTGHTAQTGDSYARLGAPAGASVSADIAAVPDASEINAEVDTAIQTYGLDHLVSAAVTGTDVTDNSIIAKLVSASATADWDDYANTTDALQALRDRGDAAWTTGAGGTPPQLLQSTTIATLSTQTSFTLTAGSADDDAYNGAIVVVTDSATATQKAVGTVSDYTGSTKTVTLSADPGIFTMATGDTIEVIAALGSAGTAPTVDQIADAVWNEDTTGHTTAGSFGEQVKTDIDLILADTGELQTNQGNWLTATGFSTSGALATVDANVDAILTDTGTTLPATLATIDGNVDAILADTAQIGAAGAGLTALATASALATVDSNVDAILTDTGTTIPATIATAQADLDIITGATGVNLLAATQASIDAIEADTNELQTDDVPTLIAGLNNLDAAGIRTAVGMASADLDTQLAALPTAIENADAVLTRDWTAVTGEAARSLLNAGRFMRNKWSVTGATMTVTKEDDITAAWTATLSSDAAADPVTGSTPV